jgi:ESS family glutamate:Na+ symporter
VFAALAIGRWLSEQLSGGALTIPAFLCCMVVGVALRNLLPLAGVRPDDRASELVAGICLALFLVMTMMTIDLVEAATAAAPVLLIAAMQGVLACVYAAFVCFRVMGRDYEAAVTTAAFVGFSVGSTATAMVNMKALVGRYGPAPTAMLIVPLAGAFFVDLANALILTALLAWPLLGG